MKPLNYIKNLYPILQSNSFPFLEKTYDDISEYAILARLQKAINDVIDNNNALNDNFTELNNNFANLTEYVNNYFKNLDVQDEIDKKLQEMAEDGTLENIIKPYIDTIIEGLMPATNFNKTLGCSTLFTDSTDGGAGSLENMKKYFNGVIQIVWLKYDTATEAFITTDTNLTEQIQAINNYIQNGGKFDGIKFHQTQTDLDSLMQTEGAVKICNAYKEAVDNLLNQLPYKENIGTIWLMNEAPVNAFSTNNENAIIDLINYYKGKGYLVSTPYANAFAIINTSKNILNANSFISLNCYPFNDIYGERSSIADVAERFNKEFRLIEPFIQNKDLYITEFGCSASWTSFNYPPLYQDDKNGKPISLMIEGFMQSSFVNYAKKLYLWYYADAINYAPTTLLSIKNFGEVRYNG